MKTNSIWQSTVSLPRFPRLEGDAKTDVLIIGGGIAGILCAYMLDEAGVDYLLVEAETICSGITKNTTAKITSQHGLIYDKLAHTFSLEYARMYLEANEKALAHYRNLCAEIDCDFKEQDAFVYTTSDLHKLEAELTVLDQLGYPASYVENLPLPMEVQGAVRFPHQAQFHPLKFAAAIAKSLHIYEHTKVLSYDGQRFHTKTGTITAQKAIIATHFPIWNKHGGYFLKLYQDRSYVLALEHAEKIDGMYISAEKPGLSFRGYGNLLCIGGGGHRTGKQGGGWDTLSTLAKKHYPHSREVYRWATQDCMTLDGIPYIGQYAKNTPNLYVATGFNKWGMTSAMLAAQLLTDLLQEKENPYTALFAPSRPIWHPQLFANMLESTANLLRFTKPRCPHMGCALTWNAQEHSWDCSCHGSRFASDGTLLDNPATGDITKPSFKYQSRH